MINCCPVYNILRLLFTVYGQVTQQALFEQKQKVQQMVYDPHHPIDGVFTAVNNLVRFLKLLKPHKYKLNVSIWLT